MVWSKLGQCDIQLRQRSSLRGIPDPLLVFGYQPMPGFDATKAYGSQFLEYPLQSLWWESRRLVTCGFFRCGLKETWSHKKRRQLFRRSSIGLEKRWMSFIVVHQNALRSWNTLHMQRKSWFKCPIALPNTYRDISQSQKWGRTDLLEENCISFKTDMSSPEVRW